MKRQSRRTHAPVLLGALAFTFCVLVGNPLSAGFTFLGPTPYLSAADSPFAEYLDGPNFYLEDFEDGELNTPGISDVYTIAGRSAVLSPSPLTDSVDGDDGSIDGSGDRGYSLVSVFITYHLTEPRANFRHIKLSFQESGNTKLPNALGFVWTDGAPNSTLLLRFFNPAGDQISEKRFHGLGDLTNAGTTGEDRFVGMLSKEPIGGVEMISIFLGDNDRSFEIDHLHYGHLSVPEPSSLFSTVISTIAVWLSRSRLTSLPCGCLPHAIMKTS